MIENIAESATACLTVNETLDISARSPWLERVLQLLLRPVTVLILLTILVVTHGINKGEFFFYDDEMRHAMNGVFFRDLLVDHPWQHPLQYAFEYYAKYPAVAVPHWPPLFYLFEGVFFLVFGFSPWVSRMTILGFALLGVYFWYRITEPLGPRYRAFLSGAILVCIPFVLLYERVTMLEVPTLGICLGAVHFWLKFVDTERRRYLWALAGFSAAGFLLSPTAVFLVFFVLLDMVVERRFGLLRRIDVWAALLTSMAVVLPWYILSQRTERSLGAVARRVSGFGFKHLTVSLTYTYYLTSLYKQLGPVLLTLACVGLIAALMKLSSRPNRLMLVWILSGYVCFVLISEKDPRHTIAWIPPFVYLGLTGIETLCRHRTLTTIASCVLALFFFVPALRSERPIVSGAERAANYVLSLPESDVVYYQGFLDADFIFFVRKFDPEKQHVVAREKQVVVSRLGYEPRSVLQSESEVLKFFQTWGIRYAIVEDRDDSPGLEPVRELLHSGQFELLREFPVQSNLKNFRVHQIQVFRYRGELHRSSQAPAIPMMTIRQNISADLSRLAGRPWPN